MTSGDPRRSLLVRLMTGVTGREPGRRHRPVLGWVLTRLGRRPDRADWTTACHQCGQWPSVSVFRLGRHRARYWCQRCGAVVTLPDVATLRPIAQLREQPPATTPALTARPRPASQTDADLREVMPAAMVRWVRARSRKPVTLERLDKSTVYQLYREWDVQLQQIGAVGTAELAAGEETPPVPALPTFSKVIGALHDACYHTDLAVQSLLDTSPSPDGAGQAVQERVEHARRWLALRGSAQCWIHSRLPPDGLATPDRPDVEAALASLRSGSPPGPADGRAARAALFGTDGGPALTALLRIYPAEEMRSALAAFLESGARPLREDVLARLAAPLDARYGHRG